MHVRKCCVRKQSAGKKKKKKKAKPSKAHPIWMHLACRCDASISGVIAENARCYAAEIFRYRSGCAQFFFSRVVYSARVLLLLRRRRFLVLAELTRWFRNVIFALARTDVYVPWSLARIIVKDTRLAYFLFAFREAFARDERKWWFRSAPGF